MTHLTGNSLKTIRLATLVLTMITCFGSTSLTFAQTSDSSDDASAAFGRLKALAGHWESSTSKGKASVTYQVVSGGTSLLEDVNMPGEKEMITVYYLDGGRLLLTHYCELGNQPRMAADVFNPSSNTLNFHFLDATGLTGPAAGHMHEVAFKFQSPNEVAQNWTFYQDGKSAFTMPVVWHRME